MNYLRTLAFVIAVGALAVPASAQQAATPQIAEGLFPVSLDTVAPSVSSSIEPALATNALLHPAAPATPSQPRFWDRQQFVALYVHSGVRLADTIKTCRALSHGGTEDWIPSQSCGGVAAWQAGSVGLTLGIGWIFHHYGHYKLERLTPWVATGASAAGLTKSVFNIR